MALQLKWRETGGSYLLEQRPLVDLSRRLHALDDRLGLASTHTPRSSEVYWWRAACDETPWVRRQAPCCCG